MTQDEIIRMARDAGLWPGVTDVFPKELERFAALVAAHEREACAKVCEEIEQDRWNLYKGRPPYTGAEAGRADPHEQGVSMGAGECAAAIRAINFEGDTGFRPVSEMVAEQADGEQWSPDDMAYRPSGLSMEQAEQEPVVKYPGCDYCNDELFCGRKCKCCGKVFIEDEDFVQSEVKSLRQQVAALKAVLDAWNNVEQEPVAWVDLEQWQSGEYDCFTSEKVADYMTPLYAAPVRTKDLTDDEISKLRHKIDWTAEWSYVNFARSVIAADREKNK